MSDLRESGAIEQDADVIGMLTRPAYYAATDAEKESLAGKAELIIAKNRNGGTGSVNMTFIENLMKFKSGAPIITTIIPNPVPAPVDNRFNRIR
jgi:replicative DNA helicase